MLTKNSFVHIRGARTHNLKSISLDVPRNKFCVFTGISGSGKSSLVMDTIFRESQRRFLNSLPSYARKFLHAVVRPDVDSITGLSPSICIGQKTTSHDPRSTVGTVTEIYSFLRLLYSRLGEMYCPQGHGRIAGGHLENLIMDLLQKFTGKKICILAPVIVSRKGRHREVLQRYSEMGFSRARINQKLVRLDAQDLELDRYKQHTIEIVVDIVQVQPKEKFRITESCKKAVQLSGNSVCIAEFSTVDTLLEDSIFFTASRTCSRCSFSVMELEPRLFSFNSNAGFCPHCLGIGYVESDGNAPAENCVICFGSRLNEVALSVLFREKNIYELCSIPVEELWKEFQQITLTVSELLVGETLVEEIRSRLGFLVQVGLGYVTLHRGIQTLSGGETQRVRLSSKINARLQGCLYILDEPSIGLHPRDNHKLIAAMKEIVSRGNTVFIIEHDEQTILAADHLVDIGPDAGVQGGEVLFSGGLSELISTEFSSWTREYILGKKIVTMPKSTPLVDQKTPIAANKIIRIGGLTKNNFTNLQVDLPQGSVIAISGVSGSGKSSLMEAIYQKYRQGTINWTGTFVEIDQSPIGRTPRSNPSTYTGMMNSMRDLYADLRESRLRGYGKSRFSFNVAGGRCASCEGSGIKKSETDFFTHDEVLCEFCNGMKFNQQTLEITYKGKNIGQVLNMTVNEALTFFVAPTKLLHILRILQDVGLGYIRLGQSSMSLSGGEAQRIKLVYELVKERKKNTVYLLDEPTTGLHFQDVQNLLHCIRVLTNYGHTVVVIEHDLDVIRCADHVIEMGPEGGAQGGKIIFTGTPVDLAKQDTPTGKELFLHMQRIEDKQKNNFQFLYNQTTKQDLLQTVEDPTITLVGLQQNNFKNVTIKIPKKKIIAITGPSGSGKSSLAYETLYLEGQRQYVETLPTYVRRFIGNIPKAKVEDITGLLPTIVVQQKGLVFNTRSTVATQTEIYDSLRVIYANAGVPECSVCRQSMRRFFPHDVFDQMLKEHLGKLIVIYAPVYRKDFFSTLLLHSPNWLEEYSEQLLREGRTKVRIDEILYVINSPEYKERIQIWDTIESIDFYIDQILIKESEVTRFHQAIEMCYQLSGGYAVLFDGVNNVMYASFFCCIEHQKFLSSRPSPKEFLFNHALGACSVCNGLGFCSTLNFQYFMRDESKTLFSGAIAKEMTSFVNSPNSRYGILLRKSLRTLGGPQAIQRVFSSFNEEEKSYLLHGFESLSKESQSNPRYYPKWIGFEKVVLHLIVEGKLPEGKLLSKSFCPDCGGDRISETVRGFTLNGLHIGAFFRLSVEQALEELSRWKVKKIFLPSEEKILENPMEDLQSRLHALLQLGLGYVQLSRGMSTLSPGETQRIRIASQLGNNLTDTLYILDEPTVGLHPSDIQNLFSSIQNIRDEGNTVIIVEHNPILIEQCDYEIALGPGSGIKGGEVVYSGPARKTDFSQAIIFRKTKEFENEKSINFSNIISRNVSIESLQLPTGVLVGFSGKSGAGKTTLLKELVSRIRENIFEYNNFFEEVVSLEQENISSNRRSLVVSFLEIFSLIRQLFSQTKESRVRGYSPNFYSFNSTHGACEQCRGNGEIFIEMHFLPDVVENCLQCSGKRYKKEVLQVFWKEKNIFDILCMNIDDAFEFFQMHKPIRDRLDLAKQLGLGYCTLGTKIADLSGGEAQRLGLIRRLSGKQTRIQKTLYVFDEPLSQLYKEEVRLVIEFMDQLVEKGNTVWVIENNPIFLKNCDHIVDIGPDAGTGGGKIVSQGNFSTIKSNQKGTTWKYL